MFVFGFFIDMNALWAIVLVFAIVNLLIAICQFIFLIIYFSIINCTLLKVNVLLTIALFDFGFFIDMDALKAIVLIFAIVNLLIALLKNKKAPVACSAKLHGGFFFGYSTSSIST